MIKHLRHKLAIFFTIVFMALICAPSIIVTCDDTADVSGFYSVNEEEEKENLKLVFEITSQDLDNYFSDHNDLVDIDYSYKNYPKPHLNLIFSPPELIS